MGHQQLTRRRSLADERGGILLLVALALPTILLVAALVMDFGNWYVHKRQVQTRVDAAALATGFSSAAFFKNCAINGVATNNAITAVARQYAGDDGGTFNTSVNDPAKLTVKVNATDLDEDDGSAGPPCTEHADGYWTEVAAEERGVTSFFAGFEVPTPDIGARARVALIQASTATGMRPFVLVDPAASTCVHARFGGAPEFPLTREGTTTQWSGPATTLMRANDISVSVRVGCGSNTQTYNAMAYVTRVGTPRILDDLRLEPGGATPCPNAYFLARNGFVSCTAQVTASVAFATPDNPAVRVRVGGTTTDLTNSTGNEWTGEITLNRRSGASLDGALPVEVETQNGPENPPGTPRPWNTIGQAVVQAGRAANQGPIVNVVLNDYARPSDSPLDDPVAPPSITVTLRDLRNSGTEVIDGAVDCQPNDEGTPGEISLLLTFQEGCSGPFAIQSGACTMGAAPFDCVRGPDAALGSLNNAYNSRWAPGNGCSRNNWPPGQVIDPPIIQPDDPRLISVFLTDAIPSVQSPNDEYPITGLGGFYVTGWDDDPAACGSSGSNGQNEPPPADAENGSVWGHYVKLVLPSADGTPSNTPCIASDSAACIAVLVR